MDSDTEKKQLPPYSPRYGISPRTPRSTIYRIIQGGDLERFKIVLQEATFSESLCIHRRERTVLHWIAYYHRHEMLSALFAVFPGLNLNIRDAYGETPLHLAARKNAYTCVDMLLELGANWYLQDNEKQTPLKTAVKYKALKAEALLAKKYDPNFPERKLITINNERNMDSKERMRELSMAHLRFDGQLSPRQEDEKTTSILDLYALGVSNLLQIVHQEAFDWNHPIKGNTLPRFIQEIGANPRNWQLCLEIEGALYNRLLKMNQRIEVALAVEGFHAFMQVPTEEEEEDEDPQWVLLFRCLRGDIDSKSNAILIDANYLSNLAHGLIDVHLLDDILENVTFVFPSLNQLGKLSAIYFVKELLMTDANNQRILQKSFMKVWKAWIEMVSDEAGVFPFISNLLDEFLKIKQDFSFPSISPFKSGSQIVGLNFINLGASGIDREEDNRLQTRITKVTSKSANISILIDDLVNDIRAVNLAYFLCAPISEFANTAWQSKNKKNVAPNLTAMATFFNQLSTMVVHDILAFKNIEHRATIIRFYLDLACALISTEHGLPDFNGAFSILSGLNNVNVDRLKSTFKLLSSDEGYIKKREMLEGIFSASMNFQELRKAMQQPCVPFIGIFQKDKVFAKDGNDTSDSILILGRINRAIIQCRVNCFSSDVFVLKTDLLQRMRSVQDSDASLEKQSKMCEEFTLHLFEGTEIDTLLEYLAYRADTHIGLRIKIDREILEGRLAFEAIFNWIKEKSELNMQQRKFVLERAASLFSESPECQINLFHYLAQLEVQKKGGLPKALTPRVFSGKITLSTLKLNSLIFQDVSPETPRVSEGNLLKTMRIHSDRDLKAIPQLEPIDALSALLSEVNLVNNPDEQLSFSSPLAILFKDKKDKEHKEHKRVKRRGKRKERERRSSVGCTPRVKPGVMLLGIASMNEVEKQAKDKKKKKAAKPPS